MKSFIFLLPVGVGLVVALGLYIDVQSKTPVRHTQPAAVTHFNIFASGRVEGVTEEIELRPRSSGQIIELHVQEGQVIEQGQLLLQLDDEQFVHEVAMAKADWDLEQAQLQRLENGARDEERVEAKALHQAKVAEYNRANQDWVRIRELNNSRAIAQQQADDTLGNLKRLEAEVAAAKARADLLDAPARTDEIQIARARIEAAKARLARAEHHVDRARLRAPVAGQILKVNVNVGEITGQDADEPSIVMADTGRFRVRAFVEELDAPRVRVGMLARAVADGLPGQSFSGKVIRLSPRMTSKQIWSDKPTERYDTKTREVWLELDQQEGLVVGLRVDVMIDADPPAAEKQEDVASTHRAPAAAG